MAKSRKGSRKGSRKTSCGSRKIRVKGYTRADGSRVKAHCSRVGKRKVSRKGSRKASKGGFRKVKKVTSMCSSLKRSVCSSNPNCRYVKRRGCFRKPGVAAGMLYEGPMLAPQ